jgi:hypothetical protein
MIGISKCSKCTWISVNYAAMYYCHSSETEEVRHAAQETYRKMCTDDYWWVIYMENGHLKDQAADGGIKLRWILVG